MHRRLSKATVTSERRAFQFRPPDVQEMLPEALRWSWNMHAGAPHQSGFANISRRPKPLAQNVEVRSLGTVLTRLKAHAPDNEELQMQQLIDGPPPLSF